MKYLSVAGFCAVSLAALPFGAAAQDTGTPPDTHHNAQDAAPATTPPAEAPVTTTPSPTLDSNGDGTMDAWDNNGDGQPDLWDLDGDGQPDAADSDGDGQPDQYRAGYEPPAGADDGGMTETEPPR